MENPNELPFAFLTQDWDIGNRFASTGSATLYCSHRVSAVRDRNRMRLKTVLTLGIKAC